MSRYDEADIEEALKKKAAYGADVDLDKYEEGDKEVEQIENIRDTPEELRKRMINVGVEADDDGKEGTILFIDNAMSHCSNKAQEGLIIMSTQKALETYSWVKDFYWASMDPTKDKYTAKTYQEESDGYFVYVKPGHRLKMPVQTCMMLAKNKSIQNLHNIIIVGDDASCDMVTGCTTVHHANDSLHVGVSEMYIGNNASLSFTMVHSWSNQTAVRPRTNVIMGKNSNYVNNYVVLDPVGTIQSFPNAFLNGENSRCSFNTMCIAHENSNIDTGGCAILNAPNTGAEIVSRNISYGGKMIARGKLVGNAPGAKAHLECKSIILKDGGITHAIPELEATCADVDMTHEAAVGKIAQDQIDYLMTRGLSQDEAVSMIVRGFLVGGISGLPTNLQSEIDAAIEKANEGD
ncbi:ABC-type transport system involved in Fe-S cluster assembly, permease component [Thermoplasmatales archaeon BRNA1]|nr:ABC-type transport system involved in Fe-S cluster assembly, permease component [Thermoplasmatales archaeon BRNA1]